MPIPRPRPFTPTSLLDLISPLINNIQALSDATKPTIDTYNNDNTTFQKHKNTVSPGQFLGQGADAFTLSVDRSFDRAQHIITKLSDFQLSCDQNKKELVNMTGPFNQNYQYMLGPSDMTRDWGLPQGFTDISEDNGTSIMDFFASLWSGLWSGSFGGPGYYDPYSLEGSDPYFLLDQADQPYDILDTDGAQLFVIERIKVESLADDALSSSYLDTLLIPGTGQGVIEGNIDTAAAGIVADFNSFREQRYTDLESYKKTDPDLYHDCRAYLDESHDQAVAYVQTIAKNMKSGYTEWVSEFQIIVGNFQSEIYAAAAIDQFTVGDITGQLNSPQFAHTDVVVWHTSNGLIVAIKPGETPAEIEAELRQYLKENGLPSNYPITIVGYKGGGNAAQQVILDGDFNVTNLVLVGGIQPRADLPPNLSVYNYQPYPSSPSKDQEASFLGLKPDQIFIPLATVAVTTLLGEPELSLAGLAEMGGEAATDAGSEYLITTLWNVMYPGQPMPDPTHFPTNSLKLYINYGDGKWRPISPLQFAEEYKRKDPRLATAQLSIVATQYVPDEPGANLNNFTNSSYLNGQPIPNP